MLSLLKYFINSSLKELPMGKPNFGFQKRQKEIAKQKKNEEKRQRKLEKNAAQPADEAHPIEVEAAESGADNG